MSAVTRESDLDDLHVEGSLAFEVSEPVNLGQLDAEISGAMEWGDGSGLVTSGGLSEEASEESPITLWVTHASGDPEVIEAAISEHKPSDQWAPQDHQDLTDLIAKVQEGEDLSDDEVRRAVVLLLRERCV